MTVFSGIPGNMEWRKADEREMELQWFVQNLLQDPPELVARKVWLHSRWYDDEHYFQVLDVAKECNARMTFCFLGRDVPHRTRVIERMLADGHEVTTHGPRHYLINERFEYEDIYNDFKPCLDDLRALGADAQGAWLSYHGTLHDAAPQALADLGVTWFSSGKPHGNLPAGLRFVPMMEPHDFEILFVNPVPVSQALQKWKAMSAHPDQGVMLFHPFILTMLDPQIIEAWKAFLVSTRGSVPAREFPSSDGRPAIVLDASLHLHID